MKNKYIFLTFIVIWIIICLILFHLSMKDINKISVEDIVKTTNQNTELNVEPVITPVNLISPKVESVVDIIITLSANSNVSTKTALRIAECESQYGKYKKNLEGSSAKGIYQFTDSTWKNYCYGDVMNDYDNINCFLKLYEKNKNWWKCK